MRRTIALLFLSSMFAAAVARSDIPPSLEARSAMSAAVQYAPELSGGEILRRAYATAGGDLFVRPGSLFLSGYNLIRPGGADERRWDRYAMWRVFAGDKADAHVASGMVRIEAWSGEELALLLAFDGEQSYDRNGLMTDQSANAMWSANFGFGAIRHGLDDGWTQTREADDLIDGEPAFFVTLTDPSGGETLFAFRQSDYAILYVGFDTPRGWHERRYSHFFRMPGSDWMQAGRVRLFYDGVKANEAIWTHYEIGAEYPRDVFQPEEAPGSPSWIVP